MLFRSARSRLYRRRFLQVNTRWKALAEIYTMHSFAPVSNINFCLKTAELFAIFCQNFLDLPIFVFCFFRTSEVWKCFFEKFCRNFFLSKFCSEVGKAENEDGKRK